jgi:hypothetical protein
MGLGCRQLAFNSLRCTLCAASVDADLPLPNRPQPADQVFTFERWNKHRNPLRYAKHLLHMFTSRVFRQLLGPVLAVMALALFVGIYETMVTVREGGSGIL